MFPRYSTGIPTSKSPLLGWFDEAPPHTGRQPPRGYVRLGEYTVRSRRATLQALLQ